MGKSSAYCRALRNIILFYTDDRYIEESCLKNVKKPKKKAGLGETEGEIISFVIRYELFHVN